MSTAAIAEATFRREARYRDGFIYPAGPPSAHRLGQATSLEPRDCARADDRGDRRRSNILEEIAAVEGVALLAAGLSLSRLLGVSDRPAHPKLIEATGWVRAAVRNPPVAAYG
ncbi:MAG: hypothetical protein J2P48_21950 [Alphaproteobacteria bacterium]|nr:hypothetical protein [Alphaproteobacteria bacterium]